MRDSDQDHELKRERGHERGRETLIDALVQTAFVTTGALNRVGAEQDVSLTQLRVFGILRDRRLRMTVLADYLGLEKSTMSGLVDRAERRGLLARAPSESDGRAVDVFLTPRGHELADRVHADAVRALAPMLSPLGAADERRLLSLLDRMLDLASPELG